MRHRLASEQSAVICVPRPRKQPRTGWRSLARIASGVVHSARNVHTGPVAEQSGVWLTVSRDVVAVVGADARSYLHGQVSQDVQSLAVGREPVDAWCSRRTAGSRCSLACCALPTTASSSTPKRGSVTSWPPASTASASASRPSSTSRPSRSWRTVSCRRRKRPLTAHSSRIGWWDTGAWVDDAPFRSCFSWHGRRLRAGSGRGRMAGDGHRDRAG